MGAGTAGSSLASGCPHTGRCAAQSQAGGMGGKRDCGVPGDRSSVSFVKTCPFTAEPAAPSSSWLYLLERFDVGVVHIDRELRVVGMNDFARRSLPVQEKLPFGKIVTSFHPEAARAKLKFLLGQAECPVNNAPPMALMINIPDRVLLIKVSKIGDAQRPPSATPWCSTTSPRW